MKPAWTQLSTTSPAKTIIFAGILAVASHGMADVVLQFSNGNYGLEGDRVGDSSSPFTDLSTGLTGAITTQALNPTESFLHVFGGLFGLKNSPSHADNGFDLQEAWTFDLNQPTTLISLQFGAAVLFDHRLFMQVQSDAWKGLVLAGNTGNAVFDPFAGTFTLSVNNAPTGIFLLFPTMTATGPLIVPAGTGITIVNLSQSPTPVRGLTFTLVPEPNAVSLLFLGCMFIRKRLRKSRRACFGT